MNNAKEKLHIEKHPLGFFLPKNADILMLGSFPPLKKRWSMNFYYPNFQNDMWRIIGLVFFNDKNYFILDERHFDEKRIRDFCLKKGIAIGDTAVEIMRLKGDASDKFLKIIKALNFKAVMRKIPKCCKVIVAGEKAMKTILSVLNISMPNGSAYCEYNFNDRTIRIYRAPSSSRAYPMSLIKKADIYKKIFDAK